MYKNAGVPVNAKTMHVFAALSSYYANKYCGFNKKIDKAENDPGNIHFVGKT